MKKILKYLQEIENIIVVTTFAIMVIVVFLQVVNRNIFQLSVSGFEEASKYCMIYMVLLGTEMGLRDGTQMAVTSGIDKLSAAKRKIVDLIAKAIIVVVSAIVFCDSVGMVIYQINSGQKSPGLQIPMSIPYASLAIAFGLITLVQGATLINMFMKLKQKEEGEQA